MSRKPDLTAEERQLKDLIRQAHEATQTLRASIREARALAPELVHEFEATHAREIHQVSNHMAAESSRVARILNDTIRDAQKMIMTEIMAGELVLDPVTGTVRLQLGAVKFDDHQQLPYPQHTGKENHQ